MQKIKLEESKMKGATREEAQVCILCRKGMENVGHVQAECCWQAIWALLVPARLSKVGYKTLRHKPAQETSCRSKSTNTTQISGGKATLKDRKTTTQPIQTLMDFTRIEGKTVERLKPVLERKEEASRNALPDWRNQP